MRRWVIKNESTAGQLGDAGWGSGGVCVALERVEASWERIDAWTTRMEDGVGKQGRRSP